MTKVKNNEIATNVNNELVSTEDMDLMSMMSADAQECVDLIESDDRIIPRIAIAQALSEVLKKKNEAKYIEGVEVGDMYNPTTREAIKGDEGFLFVPSKVIITYVEWADRDSGEGILNNFGTDATAYLAAPKNEKGARIGSKPKSEIVKTFNVYGHIVDGDKHSPVWIPMSKSLASCARQLNTLISMQQHPKTGKALPAFACVYKFTSMIMSSGTKDWFVYKVENQGMVTSIDLYNKGKAFYESLSKEPITTVADEDDRL